MRSSARQRNPIQHNSMVERSEYALCFLGDVELGQGAFAEGLHVTRERGRRASDAQFVASLNYHPFPSVSPLPSLINLDYCPKMRPTAVVRGDAPSGMFGRKAQETPH